MKLTATTHTDSTSGLNTKQWSDWRKSMLTTGTYDPNEWDRLDSYQKKWTADTLATLKSLNNNYNEND